MKAFLFLEAIIYKNKQQDELFVYMHVRAWASLNDQCDSVNAGFRAPKRTSAYFGPKIESVVAQ